LQTKVTLEPFLFSRKLVHRGFLLLEKLLTITKYILIRLTPILLLVGFGYSFFMPSSGERQFMRMEAALKKAHSYRIERTLRGGEFIQRSLTEIECPDREHSLLKAEAIDPQWDTPKFPDQEFVTLGNTSYDKSGNGEWQVKAAPMKQGANHCAFPAPVLNDGELPRIKIIRALGRIEKKGFDSVQGERCREWTVTFRQPNGTENSFEYCIGPKDDLPRRISKPDNSLQMTLTRWNQPLDIQPPVD
jgi:hypothetical protein